MVKHLMKVIIFLTGLVVFNSCNKDKSVARNPYLQEINFRVSLDLDLPLYSELNTPGSAIYTRSGGIKGLIIINSGSSFLVWEASCPNHKPSSCSTMKIVGGVNSKCGCEDYTYNLVTGGMTSKSNLKQSFGLLYYQSSTNGKTLIISN